MRFLLITLIISIRVLFAQVSLPESISSNPFQKQQVMATIEHLTELNPLIIPVYLKYLDLRFTQNITSSDSNYNNYFTDLKKKYQTLRNRFADSEIQKSYDEISLGILASKTASWIEDLYIELPNYESSTLPEESNEAYYYLYITVSGKNDPYNSSADYKKISDNAIKEKLVYFENINSSVYPESSRDELIQEALRFSYLFKDSYIFPSGYKTSLSLSSYISSQYKDLYLESYGVMFSVSNLLNAGSLKYNDDFWVINSDISPAAVEVMKYKGQINSSFPIGLGIKIPLREYKGLFSSVELKFNYLSVSPEKLEIENEHDRFFPVEPVRGTTWSAHQILSRDKTENNFYSVEIKTPVYFFYRNLFCSIGACYTTGTVSYSYHTEPIYDHLVPEHNTYKIDEKHSLESFNGFISAEYEWMNFLRAGLRFDTETGLTVGLTSVVNFRL